MLKWLAKLLDERGVILAFAAFAEELLAVLISAFLLPGKSATSLLSGFNAPLGTFSARIKAAAALGLITDRQREDLDRLRSIRNEFAHNWNAPTFAQEHIARQIVALHYTMLMDEFPETLGAKLRASIGNRLVELQIAAFQIRKLELSAKVIGIELFPGVTSSIENAVEHCKARLSEIELEIPSATGDRLRFLTAQRERWLKVLSSGAHP